MERLDKIIVEQTKYSRKEVKELVRQKRIIVNGEKISKPDIKIDREKDRIEVDNIEIKVKKYIYLMLNKPKGYISATEDKNMPTVLELIPQEHLHRKLFPAGRLDKDTTGLMLITDDGEFAHNILSPKKHIKKIYEVKIDIDMKKEMIEGFKEGVLLNDGECKSAILQITGENTGIVILLEGKYHQIKRMFGCYGAKVIELKRIGMGNFILPEDLKEGQSREFTKEELEELKEEINLNRNNN